MTSRPVNIFFGTWNVNGKPVKEDLSPWLSVPDDADGKPDLFVIGFQEFDLTPDAFVRIDEARVNQWTAAIETVLKKQGEYIQLSRCQLVGMLVIIYSTVPFAQHVSDIDTAFVGCGYTGVMGNKGGVGIRFVVGGNGLPGTGRSLCFLNSHLNAHAHNVKRRQADFESIIQRLVFFAQNPVEVPPPDDLEAVRTMMATEEENGSPPSQESLVPGSPERLGPEEPAQLSAEAVEGMRLLDHDAVFWFGDLNYRVDLPRDVILKAKDYKRWDDLIAAYQKTREMRGRRVFQGFREGPPRFRPSYKFDSGTDTYDSSGKKRLPAYCDRLLWRVQNHHHRFHGHGKKPSASHIPTISDEEMNFDNVDKLLPPMTNDHVKLIYYRSHMELRVSDHKPVSALVRLDVGKVFYTDEQLRESSARKRPQQLPVSSSSKQGYLTGMVIGTGTQVVKKYGVYVGLAALAAVLWAFWA